MPKVLFIIPLFLCFTLDLFSEVRLASCFGENMVLQRDHDITIWGSASAGEKVVVSFQGKKKKAKTDANGKWKVTFKASPYGGPYPMTIKGSNNSIEFKNVLIGDVWLCSGQSNMVWSVAATANAEAEIANASYPSIRLFLTPVRWTFNPQQEVAGSWNECNTASVKSFSAVAYFFAREIYLQTGIPQGLICSALGSSEIEPWISPQAIDSMDKNLIDHYQYTPDNSPSTVKEILARNPEKASKYNPNMYPSVLFNGMISPFTDYRIKGILWYQGENSAHVLRSEEYKYLFPILINDWREQWGYEVPFFWVQLPSYTPPSVPNGTISWVVLRESQHAALSLPQTGEAVTIDIGDAHDVHPRNKQDVGYRLALIALNKLYEKHVVYSGPIYKSVNFQDNKAFLEFDCMGSSLSVREPNGGLNGFSIAGEDQIFEQAKAYIENGSRLVVYSDKIKKPCYVRYAWENCPLEANLVNKEGLPAAPFRTDK